MHMFCNNVHSKLHSYTASNNSQVYQLYTVHAHLVSWSNVWLIRLALLSFGGFFWFPNSKVINEWVSQTSIRFIHWLRILGCIDEIGQLATCIFIWSHQHSCFQPVILLTIPTTWPLSTGNSIQWQYKEVHHFQVRLPKSYMHGYTELFQICLCVLKVLTSLPPSPTPLPIQNNTDLQMLYTWQHKMMLKKKHKVHFSCLWVYTEQMLRRSENRWSLDPESKLKFWHGMLSADAITRIKFLMGHLPGFKVSCSSKHEAKDERLLLGFSISKK